MPNSESGRKVPSHNLWDKIVFTGSIIGLLFLLFLTFYKTHISKELVIENYHLKQSIAEKDSVMQQQKLLIDSLLKK